jgi:hypothetical protein
MERSRVEDALAFATKAGRPPCLISIPGTFRFPLDKHAFLRYASGEHPNNPASRRSPSMFGGPCRRRPSPYSLTPYSIVHSLT